MCGPAPQQSSPWRPPSQLACTSLAAEPLVAASQSSPSRQPLEAATPSSTQHPSSTHRSRCTCCCPRPSSRRPAVREQRMDTSSLASTQAGLPRSERPAASRAHLHTVKHNGLAAHALERAHGRVDAAGQQVLRLLEDLCGRRESRREGRCKGESGSAGGGGGGVGAAAAGPASHMAAPLHPGPAAAALPPAPPGRPQGGAQGPNAPRWTHFLTPARVQAGAGGSGCVHTHGTTSSPSGGGGAGEGGRRGRGNHGALHFACCYGSCARCNLGWLVRGPGSEQRAWRVCARTR